MTLNRLITMALRMIMRKAVTLGQGRGKPKSEMTPQERDQAEKARDLGQKVHKLARINRRL